jgi:hypothetical protein
VTTFECGRHYSVPVGGKSSTEEFKSGLSLAEEIQKRSHLAVGERFALGAVTDNREGHG